MMDSKSIIDILQSSSLGISCYSQNEERDIARPQIQKEILILLESIQMLKIRHNSIAITARLPDELLARIFLWGMSMQYDDLFSYIAVAGVCTSWRRVALNCPQLWTAASNRKQDWVIQLALLRSGAMPLRLTLPFLKEDDALSGSMAALNEMHRIRELTLCGSRLQKVVSYLTKPAPILEKLIVIQKRPDIPSPELTLPDLPFANLTPRLRSFHLESCTLLSGTSPMPLTSLSTLSGSVYSPDPQQILGILNMVNSAPNLEDLELCIILTRGGTFNPPSSLSKIVLARLKDFTLICKTLRNCVTFLSLFDLPAVSNLTVHSYEDISKPSQDASQVFGEDAALHVLQLTSITRMAWSNESLEIQGNGNRPSSKTIVTFRCSDSSSSHIDSLFSALPLLHLATFEGAHYFIHPPLRERLGSLPPLLTLTVASRPSPFISMLLSGVGVTEGELRGVIKGFMCWDFKDSTKEEMTRGRRERGHDLLVKIGGLVKATELRAPTIFRSLKNLRSEGWRAYGASDRELIMWLLAALAALAEARHMLGAPLSKITLVDWDKLTEEYYEEAVSTIREYTQEFELVYR